MNNLTRLDNGVHNSVTHYMSQHDNAIVFADQNLNVCIPIFTRNSDFKAQLYMSWAALCAGPQTSKLKFQATTPLRCDRCSSCSASLCSNIVRHWTASQGRPICRLAQVGRTHSLRTFKSIAIARVHPHDEFK